MVAELPNQPEPSMPSDLPTRPTRLERTSFNVGMAAMAAAFDAELPEEKVRVYWRILRTDMTTSEWELAVKRWLCRGTFFPKIAELLKEVTGERWVRGKAEEERDAASGL